MALKPFIFGIIINYPCYFTPRQASTRILVGHSLCWQPTFSCFRSLAVSPRMKNSELHKLLQEEYNLPSLVIEAKCEFFERPADKTIDNNSEVELSRSKIFQPTVVLFVYEQDIAAAGSSKQPSDNKPEAGEEKVLKSKPCCIVL